MISPLAYVHPDAKLGNNVTVEPFASIAGDVVIGDDCWIGTGAVIHDGARIGKGCRIHTAASIACLPQDLKFAGEVTTAEIGDYNRVSLAGEVQVGDWVVIGGHAAIHQWTRIGDHAMIQGGALLGQDVPPFVIVRNDTLRFAGINKIGLSRRGFTPERIDEIHAACRILFQSDLNYQSGCEEVERSVPQSEDRDRLLEFIRTSQRGIIKPYARTQRD